MKPREKKPETVYRIIDRDSGCVQGSYSRAYCNEYDFSSSEEARNANCHDVFKDYKKYKIAKYKVTYELIEDDVDVEPDDIKEKRIKSEEREKRISKYLPENPTMNDRIQAALDDIIATSLGLVPPEKEDKEIAE